MWWKQSCLKVLSTFTKTVAGYSCPNAGILLVKLHYDPVVLGEFCPRIDPTLLVSLLKAGPSLDFALLGKRNEKREEILVGKRWHWELSPCLDREGRERCKDGEPVAREVVLPPLWLLLFLSHRIESFGKDFWHQQVPSLTQHHHIAL